MPTNLNNEILVFGKGWLGNRIAEFLKCNISDKYITVYEDIQSEIDKFKPKVIINCIKHTAKTVDACEDDKTSTLLSNTLVPILFAEAAVRNAIKLVHISSGCLFHYDYKEDAPKTENDTPDFYDLFYSRSKMYAEAALYALMGSTNILQLRIRMPLDFIPHKQNLLDRLISYQSVIDLPNSVTYIPDFLHALRHLIKSDCEGIYNVVNFGGLKFRSLLEKYREYYPNHSYAITDMDSLKSVRTNLILSTDKLEESGFPVRDINDIIPECVEEYVKIKKSRT